MSAQNTKEQDWYPGQVRIACEEITSLPDRETVELVVTNTGDRPVQVGSHYHFFETTRALKFKRTLAYGMRLNIPAGTAVRFEPGQSHRVSLIELAGERIIYGFNDLVNGPLDAPGARELAVEKAKKLGFKAD